MFDELLNFLTANSWAGEVFLITLGTGLVHFVARLGMNRLGRQLEKTRNLYDDALLSSVRRPLGWAIWILGICWAAE